MDWADRLPGELRSRSTTAILLSRFQSDPEATTAEVTQRLNRLSRATIEEFSVNYFKTNPHAAGEWLQSLQKGQSLEYVRNGLRSAANGSPSEALKALANRLAPKPE